MEKLLLACEKQGVVPTRFILVVSVADQTLSLFEEGRLVKTFPCSTSRFGVGQTEGSNCTPLGLHRIVEKIGDGEPAGAVFKARQVIGHTKGSSCDASSQKGDSSAPAAGSGAATGASLPSVELADAKITTRILWLEGLEPGFNRGGNVDSHARYIYIHGTGDRKSVV